MINNCLCCGKVIDPIGSQKYCNNCSLFLKEKHEEIARLKNRIKAYKIKLGEKR